MSKARVTCTCADSVCSQRWLLRPAFSPSFVSSSSFRKRQVHANMTSKAGALISQDMFVLLEGRVPASAGRIWSWGP